MRLNADQMLLDAKSISTRFDQDPPELDADSVINLKEMSDVSGTFLELLSPHFSGNPPQSNLDDIQNFR